MGVNTWASKGQTVSPIDDPSRIILKTTFQNGVKCPLWISVEPFLSKSPLNPGRAAAVLIWVPVPFPGESKDVDSRSFGSGPSVGTFDMVPGVLLCFVF